MSDQGTYLEKFDAFLLEKMSPSDRSAFLAELNTNPELKAAFELHRSLAASVHRQGRMDLKEELKAIHSEQSRSLSVAKGRNYIPWLAAASLLLLVLATWFIMKPTSNQSILATYYEPYEISANLRNAADQEALAAISKAYINKQYTSAIALMKQFLIDHEADNNVRLALAICNFENGQVPAALNELATIRKNDDPFLMDHVNWYSALFNLENNQRLSITLLEELASEPGADHHDEAKQLLSEIR